MPEPRANCSPGIRSSRRKEAHIIFGEGGQSLSRNPNRVHCIRTDLAFPNRSRIPKGFCNKAQGCEERATLGSCVRSMTTLKGLRPTATAAQRGHNPVGVVKHRLLVPRIARSSQPWALLRNPFGILSIRQAAVE